MIKIYNNHLKHQMRAIIFQTFKKVFFIDQQF